MNLKVSENWSCILSFEGATVNGEWSPYKPTPIWAGNKDQLIEILESI